MALQATALERAFRYNSVDLVDPGAQYSPDQVRDFYSTAYPEIVSAGIDGPEQQEGRLVYTFRRAVGTKGAEGSPIRPATQAEKEAAFEWLRSVSLTYESRRYGRHAEVLLEELVHLNSKAPGLLFDQLRSANLARLPQFKNKHGQLAHTHPEGRDWSPAQWLQAVVGELGEYANIRKKHERGDINEAEFAVEAAKELADVQVYLDILAYQVGVDLGEATRAKFNEVSDRVGCEVKL